MINKLQKYAGIALASLTAVAMTAQIAVASGPIGAIDVPSEGYAKDLGTLIGAILSFVMVIAALLLLLYMIWGGIEWVTSGGDKGKTESARNKITSAVIGMIILAAAFAVTNMVVYFLGFDDLQDAVSGGERISGSATYSIPPVGPK